MKNNNCPECGGLTNEARDIQGNARPSNGDISICYHCGAINQFDETLNIIPLPNEVLNDIKQHDSSTFTMIMDVVITIKANNKINQILNEISSKD